MHEEKDQEEGRGRGRRLTETLQINVPFPWVLQIETTDKCNARCVSCPHDDMHTTGLTMADGLYEKILKDASQYPIMKFIPMLNGEPLLDKKIIERVALAREYLPKTEILLYTNGSHLNEEIIQALKAQNTKIWISLNGADVHSREKLTGLKDFEHVYDMCLAADKAGILEQVSIVAHPCVGTEIRRFFNLFRQKGFMIRFSNFAGLIYKYRNITPTACGRVLNTMTVLLDGRVSLCCFDPKGSVIFGDLRMQTIEEVWEGLERKAYLRWHKMGKGQKLKLCNQCTAPLPVEGEK